MTIIIMAIGLIIDRLTKIWAMNTLPEVSEIPIVRNFFSFLYVENKGAAFGIFQDKTMFLSIASILIMVFIIFYVIKNKPSGRLVKISFALIISGALGNLIDRIKYRHVVDFISVHYKDIYYFPVFNFADVMVVAGTIILVLYLLKEEKNEN